MSTAAAPAAGASAPATPAAAPPTAPGEAGGEQSTQNARPAGERVIKPIQTRSKLPGVLEDGPEDASTREPREAPPQRGRDPVTGRFTGQSAAEPTIPGQRPDPAPEPDAVPELPEAKPKFKFAGKEWDTAEAAEQYFRSMEGRHKPIQQKATEYEAKLVKAAESARGWHGEAQRLAARVAELEAAQGKPADGAPAPEAKQGIDWDLYADITKIANEAGEPWKAQQWLVEQIEAQRKADFDAYRQEFEAPFREREASEAEQAELARTADAVVESMSAHKNPDGSPTFPELADPQTAHAVGTLWSSLGLDPKLALTPGGAVAAIAVYRLARAMDTAAQPPAPPSPSPVPTDPAAAAAAGLEGGRPLMPAASDRRSMDPSTARLVAGLKSTQLLRPGLGFEA